jgi:DNA-binding transcriptional regulator YiaG
MPLVRCRISTRSPLLTRISPASSGRGIVALRNRLGLDQAEFARRFRMGLDSLKNWELGRGVPDDTARVYLRVIERNPDAVAAAIAD